MVWSGPVRGIMGLPPWTSAPRASSGGPGESQMRDAMQVPDEVVKEVAALRAEIDVLELSLAQARQGIHQFTAMLAHELRTPLGAILMWTHVLRAGRESDRQVALDAIESSARSQSLAIATLLDVTRALAGQLPIERQSVDLEQAVRLAVEESQPAASAATVRLRLVVHDARLPVRGDAPRLRSLVVGLIKNAIGVTPAGETVEIDVRLVDDFGCIAVRDRGPCWTSAELADAFTPLRLSEGAQRGRRVGLGLEVPLARLVAELHGGTATAESPGSGEASSGCTVTVRLPIDHAP